MQQDFFEFTPQFKLLIAGNHNSGLRAVDEAIRRRFHYVAWSLAVAERNAGVLSTWKSNFEAADNMAAFNAAMVAGRTRILFQ
jgi:putative DNA primase/helicase